MLQTIAEPSRPGILDTSSRERLVKLVRKRYPKNSAIAYFQKQKEEEEAEHQRYRDEYNVNIFKEELQRIGKEQVEVQDQLQRIWTNHIDEVLGKIELMTVNMVDDVIKRVGQKVRQEIQQEKEEARKAKIEQEASRARSKAAWLEQIKAWNYRNPNNPNLHYKPDGTGYIIFTPEEIREREEWKEENEYAPDRERVRQQMIDAGKLERGEPLDPNDRAW